MHHIYQTEGIVLGSRNIGESNRLFFLFTKDFGLVVAVAQGVRELKSKLRYSLQDFGYSKTDLVRGKEIWRVTNAENINGYHSLFHDREKIALVARIFSLLRRLLHGEERNRSLFEEVRRMLEFLRDEELTDEEMNNVEIVTNLKILHFLGYGSNKKILESFLRMPTSKDLLKEITPVKKAALLAVNGALRESQL